MLGLKGNLRTLCEGFYDDKVLLFPGNLAVECARLILGTGISATVATHFLPLRGSMTSCSVCNSFILQPPMSIYLAHAVWFWRINIAARRAKEPPKRTLVLALLLFVSLLEFKHVGTRRKVTLGESFPMLQA